MFRSNLSEINRKGFWGAVIGAGVGLLGGYLSSKDSDQKADTAWDREQAASAQQFERSYGAYKTRYQDTMEDMRLAGLNPIMAASGGFNVGNSVTAQKANAPMAQAPTYEIASGARDVTQSGLNIAETRKKVQEISKVRAETLKTIAQTYVERAKKGLVTAQERVAMKQAMVLEKEIWVKIAQFQKTMKDAYKSVEERKKIAKQIVVLNNQLAKLKRTAKAYDGPAGAILGYINAITSALNLNVGAIAGFKK